MRDILYDIVRMIIGENKRIDITEKEENGTVTLELSVDKEDIGKVIGRKGKIAKAIRTVVKAAASKQNKKVNVEIV